MNELLLKPWIAVFDGDGDGEGDGDAGGDTGGDAGGGGDAGAGGGDAGSRSSSSTTNKTFTQDDVNKMLAEDRRKHKAQTEKAIGELEALKTKATLTEAERKDLESRIDTMKSELLTKEQLAKKEKDRLEKTHKKDVETLTLDRDTWKTKYTTSTIKRAITDEAVSAKAFVPEQIIAMLYPDTRLVEELDEEGTPTGEMIPKVKFRDVDKDNAPVTLDLTVTEAVKRMREIEKFQNLFEGVGTGGVGGTTKPGGKKTPVSTLAKDAKAYREARKKGELTF